GLIAGTERGNGLGHGFGIPALVFRHHLVVGLRIVEFVGELLHLFAQIAAHGMPPGNLDWPGCGHRSTRHHCHGECRRATGKQYFVKYFHPDSSPCVHVTAPSAAPVTVTPTAPSLAY